jgi:hypothetical protein
MSEFDRASLIELLERLSSADDATVLEAARALHRKTEQAGLSWDELIRPDDDDRVDDTVEEPRRAAIADPDTAEVTRLIERLLRKGVSETLRDDLTEMKQQIASGTLEPEDARYLRALARRLGV